MALVRLSDYATILNLNISDLAVRDFKTAQKKADGWYVDDIEIFDYIKNSGSFVLLYKCSDKLNIPIKSLIKMAKSNCFKTAIFVDKRWYIAKKEVDLFPPLDDSMVKMSEYCKIYNLKPNTLRKHIKSMKTVRRINKLFFIDKNETPPINNEPLSEDFITLADYAKNNDILLITLQKAVQKGEYKSAVKRKSRWFIDKNEPCHNKKRGTNAYSKMIVEDFTKYTDTYISLTEAAALMGTSVGKLRDDIHKGVYKGKTIKYHNRWYIDMSNIALVSAKDYARINHIPYDAVIRFLNSEYCKTSRKINNRWFVNKYEPFKRIK